jgi:ATPase subunit of ABC transporter with duplicated ATPase domains
MIDLEQEMLQIYEKMADAKENEINAMMDDVGEIQSMLEHNGYYIIDAKIEEVANGLGLGEIGLDRDVCDLSGGQRSKVLLTKLLLQNPMILILDEPTNFLDVNHIHWLKNYLKNYENSFILVSHDIPFLNEVVNVIYHVENAVITRYTGDYEQFKQMYELKKLQNHQAYEKQQKEIEKLEDFIARNKARVATTNMAKSRQRSWTKWILSRKPEKKLNLFSSLERQELRKIYFSADSLVIGYEEPLTRPLNIALERGKKVAIKGVNGLGKSTLLKTLLGIKSRIGRGKA